MRLRRGIVSGRPLLSAAAGAKSREEPGQERPRTALKREHGSDKPFGANSRRKRNGRRGQRARRLSRSWLRFVLIGFVHSGRTRARQLEVRPAEADIAARRRERLDLTHSGLAD
jgi:hypothetical protein